MTFTITGVIHDCPADGKKKFFDPTIYYKCPDCREPIFRNELRVYQMIVLELS